MKVFRKSAIPLLFFFGGLLLGLCVVWWKSESNLSSTAVPEEALSELRNVSGTFAFVSPLLACDSFQNISNKQLSDIKQTLVSYTDKAIEDTKASHISVYVRDLNNGPWFGLSEKETFSPGSLLKVPFMMALFKVAESDPSFLSQRIQYTGGRVDFSEYFKSKESLKENQTYTVEELIRRMIVYSDNEATLLLGELVPREVIESTYHDLGIEVPKSNEYVMTVRTYASFFRILYNGTYLTATFSEKALAFLNETTFAQGIRSVIPHSVVVSSKFGERTNDDVLQKKQLHDCGIVYEPKLPYLLCIMVRGDNFDDLSKVIATVSQMVYRGISSSKE